MSPPGLRLFFFLLLLSLYHVSTGIYNQRSPTHLLLISASQSEESLLKDSRKWEEFTLEAQHKVALICESCRALLESESENKKQETSRMDAGL